MKHGIPLPILRNASLLLSLFIVLTCIAGCKSYTVGVQKTEARADEASVVSALHTVALAQQSYAATGDGNYATFLQLSEGGFLDSRFALESPGMHGYVLTMKLGDKTFSCNADPTLVGNLKGRHFYVDSTSPLIRVNATQAASASDEVAKF